MRRFLHRFLVAGTVVMIALSFAVPSQTAWSAEKKDDKAVLDEVLDILKEKGQLTEEKYQELKTRAKKEGTGKILAGFEGWTPTFKSADGQHKIELHGRLNFDLRAYEDDARALDSKRSNQDPNRSDLLTRMLVRRARLGVDATFFKYLDMKVEGEFSEVGSASNADSKFQLTDGYAELRYWPEFRVRGGQFKVPFSFEELTSSRFIDFVERSAINNLVPARDVGAMAHGSLLGGTLEYSAGIFNGTGQNNPELNDSKDYVGRLLVRPFKLTDIPLLQNLHLAGHMTYGDQDKGKSLRGRTDGRFEFFPRVDTSGDRVRYGFEAVNAYGPFGLYGEYVKTAEERKGLGSGGSDLADVDGRGWYVAGTWLVTGEEKIHGKAPKVKKNFDPRTGGLGALELVARFAQLDFDSDDSLSSPGENGVDTLTVGFNWYLSPNARLMFNWGQNGLTTTR
ncbi:MAG TPA: porin [Verrucomicrobiae bacterium]|nr:porin [Verrucomicrobiae bacterium]